MSALFFIIPQLLENQLQQPTSAINSSMTWFFGFGSHRALCRVNATIHFSLSKKYL